MTSMQKIEPVLRGIIKVGLLVIPAVVFYVSPNLFFPYITGKSLIFRTLVEIITLCWALLILVNPVYRPRWSLITIAGGLFLGVLVIVDLLGIDPVRSFFSNFERMEGLVLFIHIGLYAVVAGSVFNTEKLWNTFWNFSIILSAGMSVYAFSQLAHADKAVRVDGTLGNPTYLAVYLLFHVFVTLWFLYRSRSQKLVASLYGLALIMQLVAIYYTQTRGTLLGLIAGVFCMSATILFFEKENKKVRYLAGGVIGLMLLGLGGFFVLKDTPFVKERPTLARFAAISLNDSTTNSRIILWTSIAWSAFKDRPVLGWGQDNFIYVFNKYYDPRMFGQEPWFDRAHSVFFDWLIAGGILGLASYLFLFVALFWHLWRRPVFSVVERAVLSGLLIGYIVHNLFVFDNLASYIFFASVLAYVHSRGNYGGPENQKDNVSQVLSPWVWITKSSVLGLGCIVLFFVSVFNPWKAGRTLIQGIIASQTGRSDAYAFFAKAYAQGATGQTESLEQMIISTNAALNATHDEKENAIAIGATNKILEKAIQNEYNFRIAYFALTYYMNTGHVDKALTLADKIIQESPRRQIFIFQKARILETTGQLDDALTLYEEGYDLDTTTSRAQQTFIGGLVRIGVEKANNGDTVVGMSILDKALLVGDGDLRAQIEKIRQAMAHGRHIDITQ